MHKVLIADAIAEEGLTYLLARPAFEVVVATGESPEAPMSGIAECGAVIVRSSAHIAPAILSWAERLRLIGRAGIGVDNIDVESNMVCLLVTEQVPHNLWLQFLAQIGIFGTLGFLIVLALWYLYLCRAL